jgi:hypothetical protein
MIPHPEKSSVYLLGNIILRGVSLKSHRAVFDACAAAGATILDDASSAFLDLDVEIPRRSFDGFQVCVGNQLDVHVPADLDQFGRDDSHGTVIGRESLVQLGHDATDRRRFFQQIDVIPGIGQIQRRLHSGDPASDHHDRSDDILGHTMGLPVKTMRNRKALRFFASKSSEIRLVGRKKSSLR